MEQGRASTTAMGTALMRAAHTRLDDPVLIEDPWGDVLVFDAEREEMRARAGVEDLDAVLRAHPSYGTVILRAHYAEHALADAVERGVRQYVIVGAGMDSFALRRPEFASELEIFEVDHPSTQELKTERLAQQQIAPPRGLHLIAADLSGTPLDRALASSSYRSDQPAFFSWLGVTTYLTREANLATLASIASCAPTDSEVVFSYAEQSVLASDNEGMQRARAHVASVGEPWVSGFEPSHLDSDVRGAGLMLVEDLGPEDLHARFCNGRSDGLTPSRGSHVAHARVAARVPERS